MEVIPIATKSRHFCSHPGCNRLVSDTYCEEHAPLHRKQESHRPASTDRGYDWRWRKFAKKYLARPEHQFCALHISSRCTGLADCVDHIHPLQGPNDPRKYDLTNLQPSCTPCNVRKGKRVIYGTHVFGEPPRE